jgi:hypothetical protein
LYLSNFIWSENRSFDCATLEHANYGLFVPACGESEDIFEFSGSVIDLQMTPMDKPCM